MSVLLTPLYNDVCSELGRGTGDTLLASKFVRAVNRALDQLSIRADLATRHSHVTSNNATVTTLDKEYEPFLYNGICYWMVRMGVAPTDPKLAAIVYSDTATRWEQSIGDYIMAEDNELMATAGTSITKLGHVDSG